MIIDLRRSLFIDFMYENEVHGLWTLKWRTIIGWSPFNSSQNVLLGDELKGNSRTVLLQFSVKWTLFIALDSIHWKLKKAKQTQNMLEVILQKWRSIERLDAPSICKCNVNVKVNVKVGRVWRAWRRVQTEPGKKEHKIGLLEFINWEDLAALR